MIIIKYCGGLGNQMYQYALQYSLHQVYPEATIKVDLFHYNLLKEHNGFELDKYFNLKFDRATKKEIRQLYNGYIPGKLMKLMPYNFRYNFAHRYQYIYFKIRNLLVKKCRNTTLKDLRFNVYNDVVFHLDNTNIYLDGLWQNIEYFQKYRDDLRNIFHLEVKLTTNDRKMLEELQLNNSVAIHVRGRDFKNSRFNICTKKYYKYAMDIIEKRIAQPKYIFFTDDPQFVEYTFNDIKDKKIISHPVDQSIIDMYLMNKAYNTIISNSTFAFWSAYLKPINSGVVIAPCFALRDKFGLYKASVPPEWITIDPTE